MGLAERDGASRAEDPGVVEAKNPAIGRHQPNRRPIVPLTAIRVTDQIRPGPAYWGTHSRPGPTDRRRSAGGVDLPVFGDAFQLVSAAVFEVEA